MTVEQAKLIHETHLRDVGVYQTRDYCLAKCATCRSGECEEALRVLLDERDRLINERLQRPRDEFATAMPAIAEPY